MNELLTIGQWQGFFQYGPEYGDIIEGQEVEFRLFIEKYEEGQFSGRIIDWNGIGANGETAVMKGFINGDQISFTKEYSHYYQIDEWGNSEELEDLPGLTVIYEGRFDKKSDTFSGTWEIAIDIEHRPDLTIQNVTTGTWRMLRQR